MLKDWQICYGRIYKIEVTRRVIKVFFDPIKKRKIATFATMNKIKTCKVNNKLIPLQATKDLFARISLIAQNRSIDLKAVFQFPLGPLPWSLAEPIGTLRKTSKASLKERQNQLIELMEAMH